MKERKLIKEVNEYFELEEKCIKDEEYTIWIVKDRKTSNYFYVHCNSSGCLYITFFKNSHISNKCKILGLKEICKVLIKRGIVPSIKIKYSNKALIRLCTKIGFRKSKKVKQLYYLKSIK